MAPKCPHSRDLNLAYVVVLAPTVVGRGGERACYVAPDLSYDYEGETNKGRR